MGNGIYECRDTFHLERYVVGESRSAARPGHQQRLTNTPSPPQARRRAARGERAARPVKTVALSALA
ncbi:MAG: hypothetical protein ACJ8AG_26165 [Ktedonobacteraceae bacterium]